MSNESKFSQIVNFTDLLLSSLIENNQIQLNHLNSIEMIEEFDWKEKNMNDKTFNACRDPSQRSWLQ